MPARAGNTILTPGNRIIHLPHQRKGRGRGRVSPTGPYRAQSSVPKIREKATPAERQHIHPDKAAQRERRAAARDAARAAKAVKKATASRPIRTLQRAEAKLAKQEDPKLREAARRLRHALAEEAHFKASRKTPEGSPVQANMPKPELKSVAPQAYRKSLRTAEAGGHGSSKGLHATEDLTNAITLAAPGSGVVGRGLEMVGEKLATKLGSKAAEKLASQAEQTAAENAAKGVLERARLRAGDHVKAKVERVKGGPHRLREEPLKTAARHPLRTGVPAAAVSPVPLPGHIDKRARAFLEGTAAALTHPGKVAETTGHGLLGMLTFPLAAGGAAVASAKEGSPEPLEELGSRTVGGLAEMAGDLASGNAKKVEETTLQKTGLTPFLPGPAILRRLKGTKAYEDLRGAVRAAAEARRATARDHVFADQAQRNAAGDFVSPKEKAKAEKMHSVEDSQRPGEHYVGKRLGRLREKQRARHWLAREVGRMQREGEISGQAAAGKVVKILQKSKGTDQSAQNYGEAFRIVAKHGIPKDAAKGLAYVHLLHDNWPKIKEGKIGPGVHLDRHSTKFILDHPQIFEDPHFWKAVEVAHDLQKPIGTSPRNQYLAQVHNLINPLLKQEGRGRILAPEEMIRPGALRFLPKRGPHENPWTRSEALDYMDQLRKQIREDHATAQARKGETAAPRPDWQEQELRAVKELERRGQVPKGSAPNGGHLAVAQRDTRAARAEALVERAGRREAQLAGLEHEMKGLMKPPEHGGAAGGVSTTKADWATPEMKRAFVRAAKREGKHFGLKEPNPYIADVMPSTLHGGDTFPDYGALNPLRKVWPSQGKAARSGNALSDFESVMYHSFHGPRARAATLKGLTRIFDRGTRKIGGKRYLTYSEWEKAANQGKIPPSVVPIRTQFLRALLEGDHPVDPARFRQAMVEEVEHGQQIVGHAGKELAGEMQAAKDLGIKGEKFAAMDATTMHELMAHMEGPSPVSRAVGHATNASMRAILNSPAFEMSQFAQEGIPGALALGRDIVHVPWAIKNLKEIDKLPPEEQAAVKATIGAGSGLNGVRVDPLKAEGFMDPIRAAGPPQMWRRALHLLNGDTLRRIDQARAGRFREVAAMARVKGELNRAEPGFMRWRANAKGLFKDMHQAVNDMKGMGVAERHLYIAEHPVLSDRMTREMRGMMGDWNSFTVFEKHFAPFAIFYPFQRYAALWGLYHFPLDHPFVATSLAALGEVNAQELQKLAAQHGAAPSPLDYTKPVIPTGHGKSEVLPGGQRFSPILGSLEQAAIEGKSSQAIGGLSPALGIPIEAATGKNSYTGEGLGESGWTYALRQIASLAPLSRFLGVPQVGQSPSAAKQAFHVFDPLREARSVWDAYIGQSGAQYGKEQQLAHKFDLKYGKGKIPGPFDSQLVQELLYGGPGGTPQPHLLPKVLQEIHTQEGAANFVKHAEKAFQGKEKPFSPLQKELLEAVENAWKTGPSAASSGGGWRGGSSSAAAGGGWRSAGAVQKKGWRG